MADWLEPTMNESTRVMLKKIVDAQSFDFRQVGRLFYVYIAQTMLLTLSMLHFLINDCVMKIYCFF